MDLNRTIYAQQSLENIRRRCEFLLAEGPRLEAAMKEPRSRLIEANKTITGMLEDQKRGTLDPAMLDPALANIQVIAHEIEELARQARLARREMEDLDVELKKRL